MGLAAWRFALNEGGGLPPHSKALRAEAGQD
jgi:hypothetical protein